jgi:hypothetical protein
MPKTLSKLLLVLAFAGLLSAFAARAQDEYDYLQAAPKMAKWETFDFAKQKVRTADLNKMSLAELALLRGIVFGKRGRIFKEKHIQSYLAKRPWYKASAGFRNASLTATERQNLDAIRLAEAEKHDYVKPGDMRIWQKKAIPEDKVYAETAAEWRILIAEVEAIHGKTFPEEPWLQKYFEERYWYKANPKYSPTVLTEIEQQNIELLTKKRDENRKVAVSVGDMDKFQDVLLTEKMLEGVTLNDLRMMRNEIYARRGKKFNAVGIQQFFEWRDWYTPVKDQSKIVLSETEKQNADLLLRVENRLREEIATKPAAPELFEGMFTEDLRVLRNEIYARRGRVFKSKDLNDYFKEQSWYKPDPNYSDNLLSEVEKENLKIIKEAEDAAVSKFLLVEG